MDRPPSRSSLYHSARPLLSPATSNPAARPTLPSLRSQVGEFLPEPPASHPPRPLHYSPDQTQAYRHRLPSMSSSSMHFPSSTIQTPFLRPPSAEGHRYSSTSMEHYRSSTPGPNPPSSANPELAPSYTSGATPNMAATRSAVSVACTNCRTAHLACSDMRPCRRCVQTGRSATCIDVEPRKRGRPRASDMALSMSASMTHNSTTESSIPVHPNQDTTELVIIMSTSLRCALVTAGVTQVLGHASKSILEHPLSTFIHPDEKHEYARFYIGLLESHGVASRPVPVSAARLHQASLNELLTPLAGSSAQARTFRLRAADNTWPSFRFESYLGGGFGAHLTEPESLRLTYVILKLTPLRVRNTTTATPNNTIPTSRSLNYEAIPSPSASFRSPSQTRERRAYELELSSSSSSFYHARPPSRSSSMMR